MIGIEVSPIVVYNAEGDIAMKRPLWERFWEKVEKRGDDECWEWIGGKTRGYGEIWDHDRQRRAHRVSWEWANGPIPKGKFVCHTCDNRACVNPKHLWLGSIADNQRDMAMKKRSTIGERNPHSKLTEEDVREIRASSLKRCELAKIYKVGHQAISQVILRQNWAHVH